MFVKIKTFHRKKIVAVFALCMAAMLFLIGRLGYLMLLRADYYSEKAQDLHERERSIKAARGKILDCNGKVLADNKTVCTISVIHSQIKEPEKVIDVLTEELGLERCGTHGTTAALALLNDAVKKGGVMASNHVGGLSGAFIPVSEDDGMIKAAECGSLTLEKLEAMTAVCSVGIDMVIIPGDTTPAVISALIADEAAIGMVNSKTTAVRVIPAIGRKAGEVLDFGGLLGYGPIMAVNQHDPSVFINRGGRLPAPMQSLKN